MLGEPVKKSAVEKHPKDALNLIPVSDILIFLFLGEYSDARQNVHSAIASCNLLAKLEIMVAKTGYTFTSG